MTLVYSLMCSRCILIVYEMYVHIRVSQEVGNKNGSYYDLKKKKKANFEPG